MFNLLGPFFQVDVGLLAHWSDFEAPEDPAAAEEALVCGGWRALPFAKGLNTRLGVAPSTEAVFQKSEENGLRAPAPLRPVSKGVAAEVKARMWAKRWRHQGGARHGKLRISDEVPLLEMWSKARLFRFIGFQIS